MSFVAVRSYDNHLPASMMMQRLEAEGIKAYLQDEHTITIGPMFSNALGGIKLMVYSDQLERATKLVIGFESEYLAAGACPNCGSHEVQFIARQNRVNWFTAIVTWLFSNYAIAPSQVYHCYHCNHEFENLPE